MIQFRCESHKNWMSCQCQQHRFSKSSLCFHCILISTLLWVLLVLTISWFSELASLFYSNGQLKRWQWSLICASGAERSGEGGSTNSNNCKWLSGPCLSSLRCLNVTFYWNWCFRFLEAFKLHEELTCTNCKLILCQSR